MNICPTHAIALGIKGVKQERAPAEGLPVERGFWKTLGKDLWDPAVIFIFGIFSVAAAVAANNFTNAISRLLQYFAGI